MQVSMYKAHGSSVGEWKTEGILGRATVTHGDAAPDARHCLDDTAPFRGIFLMPDTASAFQYTTHKGLNSCAFLRSPIDHVRLLGFARHDVHRSVAS